MPEVRLLLRMSWRVSKTPFCKKQGWRTLSEFTLRWLQSVFRAYETLYEIHAQRIKGQRFSYESDAIQSVIRENSAAAP